MRVGCIYSIENYCSIDKPMRSPMEIPFGISIIATVLKVASHDVDLFVNFNQRMFNHLFLIPTWEQIGDFLGIVGTTLSSISMANPHIFAKKSR